MNEATLKDLEATYGGAEPAPSGGDLSAVRLADLEATYAPENSFKPWIPEEPTNAIPIAMPRLVNLPSGPELVQPSDIERAQIQGAQLEKGLGGMVEAVYPAMIPPLAAYGGIKGAVKGIASGEGARDVARRAGRAAIAESSLLSTMGKAAGVEPEPVLATKELGYGPVAQTIEGLAMLPVALKAGHMTVNAAGGKAIELPRAGEFSTAGDVASTRATAAQLAREEPMLGVQKPAAPNELEELLAANRAAKVEKKWPPEPLIEPADVVRPTQELPAAELPVEPTGKRPYSRPTVTEQFPKRPYEAPTATEQMRVPPEEMPRETQTLPAVEPPAEMSIADFETEVKRIGLKISDEGGIEAIDPSMRRPVIALNNAGIVTVFSESGHGKANSYITVPAEMVTEKMLLDARRAGLLPARIESDGGFESIKKFLPNKIIENMDDVRDFIKTHHDHNVYFNADRVSENTAASKFENFAHNYSQRTRPAIEPPAAPAPKAPAATWYRGERPENAGSSFYSQSEDVAGNYGKVRKVQASELPRNPLQVSGKEELAQIIKYEGDPLAEPLSRNGEFDRVAAQYAKSRGHDGIYYENGTFGEPEMVGFKEPPVSPAPETPRATQTLPAVEPPAAAAKQPWEMTRKEIAKDPRFRLAGDMGETIARAEPDGRIAISDAFFGENPASRAVIIEHELDHALVDSTSPAFWRIVDSGAIGKYNETARRWEGIAPGRNPEETLTHLISDIRNGKKPAPPEVLAEYPDLAAKAAAAAPVNRNRGTYVDDPVIRSVINNGKIRPYKGGYEAAESKRIFPFLDKNSVHTADTMAEQVNSELGTKFDAHSLSDYLEGGSKAPKQSIEFLAKKHEAEVAGTPPKYQAVVPDTLDEGTKVVDLTGEELFARHTDKATILEDGKKLVFPYDRPASEKEFYVKAGSVEPPKGATAEVPGRLTRTMEALPGETTDAEVALRVSDLATSERGGLNPSALVKNVSEMGPREILPAARTIAGYTKDTLKGIVKLLAPSTLVKPSYLNILYRTKAGIAQKVYDFDVAVREAVKFFDHVSTERSIAFIDAVKRGNYGALSVDEIQYAKMLRALGDNNYEMIKNLPDARGYLENHLRVKYKPGPALDAHIEKQLSNLRGPETFKHSQIFEDLSQAIKAGLEPTTTNPFRLIVMERADIAKSMLMQKSWKLQQAAGGMIELHRGTTVPQGFKILSEAEANALGLPQRELRPTYTTKVISRQPNATGEGRVPVLPDPVTGYAVDENLLRLYKNWASKDWIRSVPAGRGLVAIKNGYTMAELSLNLFHMMFVTADVASAEGGMVLRKMANLPIGESLSSPKNPNSIFNIKSPIGVYKEGQKINAMLESQAIKHSFTPAELTEYADKIVGPKWKKWSPSQREKYLSSFGQMKLSPETMRQTDMLFEAGLEPRGQGLGFKMDNLSTMHKAMADKEILKAMGNMPPAAMQKIMSPLFDNYIPRLKLGLAQREMALSLAENEMRIAKGMITEKEIARNVVNFVEDRLGELNYDNLWWNKTFKTAMQTVFRSVTWNLGTARAVGGAIPEQAVELHKYLNDATRGVMLTPKAAWVVSMTAETMAMGAATMYALTGIWPESLKDYFYPRTDPNDPTQRAGMMTYAKEVAHAATSPGRFLAGKTAGIWHKAYESFGSNKDFYGNAIASKYDNPVWATVKKFVNLLPVPISVSSAVRSAQLGEPAYKMLMGPLGMPKAGRDVSMTDMQRAISEYSYGQHPSAPREADVAEKSKTMARLRKEMDTNPDKANKEITDLIMEGKLAKHDIENLHRERKHDVWTYNFGRMPVREAFDAIDQGSTEEVKQFLPMMHRKIQNQIKIGAFTPKERQEYTDRFQRLVEKAQ